jgi:hypothetical protein
MCDSLSLSLLLYTLFGYFVINVFQQRKLVIMTKKRCFMEVLLDHVVSWSSKDEVGMSKNHAHLNFGFLFGLINGFIDDKVYVPR